MKRVRTRYAPSPTGFLHIGGARTALVCYLFAKHNNGDFIVRTEDTDIARNVEGGENSQLNNLEWLGVIPDESPRVPNAKYGPYRQSEKLNRYNELIDKLLATGKAYKAYDSSEELSIQKKEQEKNGMYSFRYDKNWLKISNDEKERRDAAGEYTIRIKLKDNYDYSWDDMVRGKITVNTKDIGDWVIRKQNGYPTYNFGVVVDDHDMEITHVIRGEEHTTNTPKQLAVYDALDWDVPTFCHLTIVTNMEGKKLSKRDTSVKQFIEDYKNEGYLPEAIFNFLALLGWTHPEAKEKMSRDELIKSFVWERLSKSPSKFDIKKMNWFAKEYMREKDNEFIISHMGNIDRSREWIEMFVETYKQSALTINEIKQSIKIYNDKSTDKNIEKNDVVKVFTNELFDGDFTIENISKAISATQKITGVKGKGLYMPIRLATTYVEHGPELAKAIFLFGENVIKERLK